MPNALTERLQLPARLAFIDVLGVGSAVPRKVARLYDNDWLVAFNTLAYPGAVPDHLIDALEREQFLDEVASAREIIRASGKTIDDYIDIDLPECHILDERSHLWPHDRLKALGDYEPVLLFARGNLDVLANWEDGVVTVTGARAATGYGEHVAMEISAGLVRRGYGVLTGLSYGIDGMATRACLASDSTRTAGILASGIDRPYPSGHEALIERVTRDGLLMSEVFPGKPPTKQNFLARSRLLGVMSHGTVVVEAGRRSGALRVAEWADQVGRPVGAVPGPVTSAASSGCHELIREGTATLVQSVEQVDDLIKLYVASRRRES